MRTRYRCSTNRHQHGSAVIVVLALVAIVLIYIAGNVRTLRFLTREVKLVEQRQVRRLAAIKIHRPAVIVPAGEATPGTK
jgi:type II secretory pathway component PulK